MAEDQDVDVETGDDDTPEDDTAPKGAPQDSASDDAEALRKQIAELEADRDTWKKRSRQHEDRAKKNQDDARAKQSIEEQLEQMRADLAERDAAAVEERAGLATEKLHAKLVRGGISDDDATALIGAIDPMRLLEDGKPDSKEIDRLAKSLTKIATRPAADADQGRKGGDSPRSMNQIIRDAAKRNNVVG